MDNSDYPDCPYISERGLRKAIGYVETGQMSEADLIQYLSMRRESYVFRGRLNILAPTWLMRYPERKLDDYIDDLADPEQRDAARMDFGSLVGRSQKDFFPSSEVLDDNAEDDRPSPILNGQTVKVGETIELAEWFKPDPLAAYAIAFDYSGGGKGSTDGTGCALGHFDPITHEMQEDFSFRVKASPGELMLYEPLNQLVRDLESLGFRIAAVGFDQFASQQSMEILEKEGFNAFRVKHADSVAGCFTLRGMVHSGQYKYSSESIVFIGECKELQEIIRGKTRRIDHKSSGGAYNSKDVWDASVNMVYLAMDAFKQDQGDPLEEKEIHRYPEQHGFDQKIDVSFMSPSEQKKKRLPGHNGFALAAFLYCRYEQEIDSEIVSLVWGAVEQSSNEIWILGCETSKVPLRFLSEWLVECLAPWQEMPFMWRGEKGSFWLGMFDDPKLEVAKNAIRSEIGLQSRDIEAKLAPTLKFELLRECITEGGLLFPCNLHTEPSLRHFMKQLVKYPFGANDYVLQSAYGLIEMSSHLPLVAHSQMSRVIDFDDM